MLVSPLRIVKRFTDLTPAETADLFQVCRLVSEAVETEFKAQSLTVTIQDGPQAGQSVEVKHVSSLFQILTTLCCNYLLIPWSYIKLLAHAMQSGTLILNTLMMKFLIFRKGRNVHYTLLHVA